MPIPVSVTATRRGPPSGSATIVTVTVPAGVNFTALLTRFTTICLTFARSLDTGGRSPSIFVATVRRDRATRGSSSASTSRTSSARSIDSIVSGMRPASMREMSRMSLMRASRCCAFESTRERLRSCFSWSGPATPSSSRLV